MGTDTNVGVARGDTRVNILDAYGTMSTHDGVGENMHAFEVDYASNMPNGDGVCGRVSGDVCSGNEKFVSIPMEQISTRIRDAIVGDKKESVCLGELATFQTVMQIIREVREDLRGQVNEIIQKIFALIKDGENETDYMEREIHYIHMKLGWL
jgi:hypothetical protein